MVYAAQGRDPCGYEKGGALMDIKKLIEQLSARGLSNGSSLGYHSGLFDEAATALSTLQAENEKLRAEVESLKKEHCAGCSVPVVEAERLRDLNEAPKLRAELEQVTMERNAAVKDLEDLMADTEDSVCWLCAKADSTEPCRGAKGTCTPKWRGIQTDSNPYLVADEATEFNRDQWDWLLGRFTRKED